MVYEKCTCHLNWVHSASSKKAMKCAFEVQIHRVHNGKVTPGLAFDHNIIELCDDQK